VLITSSSAATPVVGVVTLDPVLFEENENRFFLIEVETDVVGAPPGAGGVAIAAGMVAVVDTTEGRVGAKVTGVTEEEEDGPDAGTDETDREGRRMFGG
jgi:hypothetical protein